MRSRRARSVSIAALLVLAACRAGAPRDEPPLELARFEVASRCYAGSPIRGILPFGSAEALDLDPEHAFVARFGVEWLERDPGAVGEPLGRVARLIGARKGEEPIQARVRLAADARLVRGEELARFDAAMASGAFGRRRATLDEVRALPAGTTQGLELSGARERRAASIAVELHRAADGRVELAFVFSGEVERDTDDLLPADKADARKEREPWRELVVLETADDARFAIVCPAPFDGGEGRALCIAVAFGPRGADLASPEHAKNVEAALAGARAAERAVHERSLRMEAPEERERERKSALESLALAPNRRAALVFLAAAAGAELCGDLALVADDAVLGELVQALAKGDQEDLELARDGAALAWHLERGAWSFLVAKLGGDAPVPAELRGLTVRHAGELARSAGALEDVLAASRNGAELARRLVDENRALLEDASPAARVRAFDWLATRGSEPKGFDPLAADAERRKALDASEEPPR